LSFALGWRLSRGQQAFETAADDRLGHNPVDQFLAGRNVVDEPGDDPAALGTGVHLSILQHAMISRSADEVANVLSRCGGALVAFDGEDFLYSRIGQHALSIAQWPHDQACWQ